MGFFIQGLTFILSSFAEFEASQRVKVTDNFFVFLATIRLFPFLLKPLYGFISDVQPVFRYRFKSYLIGCILLQLVISLLLYFLDDPSLKTLLFFDLVLNFTCAFISSLLEGIITIVTKIDSKVRYPMFLENRALSGFESNRSRYLGIYQFLFLSGDYLFSYLSNLAASYRIFSPRTCYLLAAGLTFVFGVILIYFFKERKERKNLKLFFFFFLFWLFLIIFRLIQVWTHG